MSSAPKFVFKRIGEHPLAKLAVAKRKRRAVRVFVSYYDAITTDPEWQVRDHYAAPGGHPDTGTLKRVYEEAMESAKEEVKAAFREMYKEMVEICRDAEYSDEYGKTLYGKAKRSMMRGGRR